mmetsp:Transcript_21777/g.64939  ORF Transcript_21777/g.64939 Transcript_21777/m.64939 type:complete len:310 (+) Transcript_21777:586-1515(+)
MQHAQHLRVADAAAAAPVALAPVALFGRVVLPHLLDRLRPGGRSRRQLWRRCSRGRCSWRRRLRRGVRDARHGGGSRDHRRSAGLLLVDHVQVSLERLQDLHNLLFGDHAVIVDIQDVPEDITFLSGRCPLDLEQPLLLPEWCRCAVLAPARLNHLEDLIEAPDQLHGDIKSELPSPLARLVLEVRAAADLHAEMTAWPPGVHLRVVGGGPLDADLHARPLPFNVAPPCAKERHVHVGSDLLAFQQREVEHADGIDTAVFLVANHLHAHVRGVCVLRPLLPDRGQQLRRGFRLQLLTYHVLLPSLLERS